MDDPLCICSLLFYLVGVAYIQSHESVQDTFVKSSIVIHFWRWTNWELSSSLVYSMYQTIILHNFKKVLPPLPPPQNSNLILNTGVQCSDGKSREITRRQQRMILPLTYGHLPVQAWTFFDTRLIATTTVASAARAVAQSGLKWQKPAKNKFTGIM